MGENKLYYEVLTKNSWSVSNEKTTPQEMVERFLELKKQMLNEVSYM